METILMTIYSQKMNINFINQSIIFANQKINNIYTSLYNLLGMQFCKTIKRIWLGLLIGSKNQLSSKKKVLLCKYIASVFLKKTN